MTKPGDLPATKGTCITTEMRKDRVASDYKKLLEKAAKASQLAWEKEHKLRQEAEGELTIVKTITIDSSPEMRDAKAKIKELQDSLDRFKKENNECYNRIAELTDSLESKDYFKDPDYKFLVDENHRLEQQYLEVMADNKKLALEIEDRVNQMRKSGM